MLLSAAIIVKDEADHLPGCIAAIADVVDEIVVLDTGSTDGTVDVATAAGAEVVLRPWDGSFANARNAALERAHGQWILDIDADERLGAADRLRNELAATDAVAGSVRFRCGRLFTPYLEYRLFRNRPDVRFRGVIHETTAPDINRLVAKEGAEVVDLSARIDHLGYEGDQRNKHLRNLPLLRREVTNDPSRVYLWFHLGVVYQGLGDVDAAEDAWARGVAEARRRAAPSPVDDLVYAMLALLRLRAGEDAADLVADLRRHHPDDPLTAWTTAHQCMADGRWADAVPLLEGLVAADASAVLHPVLAYDRRLFGELSAHCLGLCWFHLGDDGRAERWFAAASGAAPDVEEYRLKRDLAAARAGRARRAAASRRRTDQAARTAAAIEDGPCRATNAHQAG
jgi:tetratricopeptide (TPR) repeat protein